MDVRKTGVYCKDDLKLGHYGDIEVDEFKNRKGKSFELGDYLDVENEEEGRNRQCKKCDFLV